MRVPVPRSRGPGLPLRTNTSRRGYSGSMGLAPGARMVRWCDGEAVLPPPGRGQGPRKGGSGSERRGGRWPKDKRLGLLEGIGRDNGR
jgi:hypothetical protein